MDVETLIAFSAAAALLTVVPGLDTALVLRTAASEGSRRALLAGVGICLGCLAWGVIVAVGLGVLLAASELAYAVLKWVGAAYLVWLGFKLITAPRRDFAGHGDIASSERSGLVWLRRGLLTNILNPKVGVFYVPFLPQFIPAGSNVPGFTIMLASIHAGLGLLWFAALIAATRRVSAVFRRAGVVTWLDRITGGLFVGFGVRLAL